MIIGHKRTLRIVSSAFLVATICVIAISQQRGGGPRLNETAMRAHIKFLSSDLLEGRGTGARGGELAANYIAAQLEALGLKGAGAQGSFFQPVSLVGVKADPNTKLSLSGRGGKERFNFSAYYV